MLNRPFKIALWIGFLSISCLEAQQTQPDSAYWHLPLPELEKFRSYYLREVEALQKEKETLIRRGIADGERLLLTAPDTSVLDDILIRLADLYYYKEKDDYLQRMDDYDDILGNPASAKGDSLPPEPNPSFPRSLALYDRIIATFPKSDMVDDALYNKGFLYEETGDFDRAVATYRKLIETYPASSYVPEAYMRLGEYFFNPPRNEIEKAIVCYEKVVGHPSHVRYYEALYKLGWSYYRLSQYPEAISYFTTLVEDQQKGLHLRQTDDDEAMHFRDEALEYIAISFLDFGGPQKAGAYVRQLGNPSWGKEMLEKMGDIYMKEKEEYRNAIVTYGFLRQLVRNSDEAPEIQKKIIDCYAALNEFQSAFEARQNLFLDYQPGSVWWDGSRNEKSKLKTYRLSEESLRENFNWLLKEAATEQSVSIYERTVESGRLYLKAFPEDPYAYQIRWNVALLLDTQLKRYQEALQEYLTLSMVYHDETYESFAREKGLNTIQDAAENAIVVAEILYQEELKQKTDLASGEKDFFNEASLDSVPLSSAGKWLALAYDNFIKLFPFDVKTPTMLTNAGALYYSHNQFDSSLKYFKTLLNYFPESPQAKTIQYAILENYFGKRDYDSVELLAKKILMGDFPAEIKNKSERRLGEALFLKAEQWAAVGEHEKAATEFLRLTLEVPKISFADRALFNAGQEYEKARRYPPAIRAYEQLRVSYSGSTYILTAINNLALDYAEIGEYVRASDRYLELSNLSTDSVHVHDGLYNAHLFAVKGRDWNKAITTGERYATQYPHRAEASQIYFRMASYADSTGEKTRKRSYLRNFPNRFPGSSLAVEAAYRLGQGYLEADSLTQAQTAFDRAQVLNQTLPEDSREGTDFYAAEALMAACKLLWNSYRTVEITGSGATRQSKVDHLISLRDGLVRRYRDVIGYQTIRLPEALFQIGEVQEQFASIWARQTVVETDPAKRAVQEKSILRETTQVLRQAFQSHSDAVRILRQLQEKESLAETSGGIAPSVRQDSSAALTGQWLARSEDKISETLFRIADLNVRVIDQLLAVPLPADLRAEAGLEYRSQVLVKAIRPLLDAAIEAHLRNLSVSDSLNLDNPWMEASRQKVVAALAFLGQSYSDLSCDGLDLFEALRLFYLEEMKKTSSDAESETPAAMATLIESARTYSGAGIGFYKIGLERLKQENFLPRIQSQFKDSLVAYIGKTHDRLVSLHKQALDDQSRADSLFRVQQNILYENMLTAFEDNAYYISENQKTLLESGYQILHEEQDPRALSLGIDLLKLDPDSYADRLEISVDTLVVPMDSTWLVAANPLQDWTQIIPDSSQTLSFRTWFHSQKGTESEHLRYIGKGFHVQGEPIAGRFETDASGIKGCYLNGRRVVIQDKSGDIRISEALRAKNNWFALEVSETEPVSLDGKIQIHYVRDGGIHP